MLVCEACISVYGQVNFSELGGGIYPSSLSLCSPSSKSCISSFGETLCVMRFTMGIIVNGVKPGDRKEP